MKKSPKPSILPIAIAVLIVGGFLALNVLTTEIAYEAEEIYTEAGQYLTEECETKYDFEYDIIATSCSQYSAGSLAKATCKLENIETQYSGYFEVEYGFNITDAPDGKITTAERVWLNTSETKYLTRTYDGEYGDFNSCICKAIAPSYEECRTVSKYGDVNKTRTVTKYRTVTFWEYYVTGEPDEELQPEEEVDELEKEPSEECEEIEVPYTDIECEDVNVSYIAQECDVNCEETIKEVLTPFDVDAWGLNAFVNGPDWDDCADMYGGWDYASV